MFEHQNSRARGFTLIELLVSIAIIALLSSIVFSIQSKFRMRARDAQRVQNAEQLVKALQLYANGDIAGVDFPVSGLLSADGTGFVAKDSNDDAQYASSSLIRILSDARSYTKDTLIDPIFGKDNYYFAHCPSKNAYALFLKVEQPDLQIPADQLATFCGGPVASAAGMNFVYGVDISNGKVASNVVGWGGSPPPMKFELGDTFSVVSSAFPGFMRLGTPIIANGNMYMIGGDDGAGGYRKDIFYAPVTDPLSWSTIPNAIPRPIARGQIHAIGDRAYIFGGADAFIGATNKIFSAPLSDMSNWVTEANTLPKPIMDARSAVVGGKIYIFGGYTSSDIYEASVSSPTVWATSTNALPFQLADAQIAVVGDYLYLFGGYNYTASQNILSALRAPVSDPTSWTEFTNILPTYTTEGHLAIVGDYVYILGGMWNFNTFSTWSYRAPLSNPLSWSLAPQSLPNNLRASQMVVLDDALYFFAGYGWTTNILRAPISSVATSTSSPDVSQNPPWKVKANQ